ncbi:FRG domain protein [Serratia ficaria]|uniref:FRG domain-containing protein n=1 Tax=Serratia ficaria TaxID=61651 RepID=UPI00119BCAE6|nr:FRG domain-containing protein [Serratia ficaria]VVA49376.1 FRG domain protein [Serratia ficaria]
MESEHRINHLADFLRIVHAFDYFDKLVLFRGQNIKGNLLPSIARNDHSFDTTEIEMCMLDEFRRVGGAYLNGRETDWEIMVLAQHHGMKTRLLDWTSNPLVALWFACEDYKNVKDSYVYMLSASKHMMDMSVSPFKIKETKILSPKHNNPRISAQSGYFSVHRFSKRFNTFVPLDKNLGMKESLLPFVINGEEKKNILKGLNKLGVNHHTVYPGLEGMCKGLTFEMYENRPVEFIKNNI